ncbi:MAG: DoxX family membrane protein [Chloroflexaceae bacterium]|jgi:thiosulfate dehydrogenase [quinone] large subunit|nr:DoxX family membrane protein [Chloroflexaceae bacterium]
MKSVVAVKGEVTIPDPPIAHALFSTTRFAWLFLILRMYLGYAWIDAGWHKVTDPKWVETGVALKGFWTNAVRIPETGRPPIAFDWYRSFIQFMLDNEWYTWFAKLVAYGEVLIGVALVVGAFVGIAAFFGALMNWNFIMAGAASTNAVLFTLAIILMLAWKVAGWYGLDRFLLAYLGTPWKREEAPRLQTNPV